ncbi:unnamed protein product [Ilex paraguariensis]|uniref:Uncharacterized protein n=1 Tax=Ilex paraguariensis TaxID=185542 RepID=A0ABC8R5B4_9AQUA
MAERFGLCKDEKRRNLFYLSISHFCNAMMEKGKVWSTLTEIDAWMHSRMLWNWSSWKWNNIWTNFLLLFCPNALTFCFKTQHFVLVAMAINRKLNLGLMTRMFMVDFFY